MLYKYNRKREEKKNSINYSKIAHKDKKCIEKYGEKRISDSGLNMYGF